jgi:formylglycine-generating enzyme required for sulfatase activity
VKVPTFFMGKFVVTQAQWQAIATLPKVKIDLNPDPSNFKGDNRPVEQVSWNEAVEFCDRLSRKTGRTYRLPSEAEWEYACRAGTTTPFHTGATLTNKLANSAATFVYGSEPKGEYRQQTTPVGTFPPNAFGLCDMHGNVWEWCQDVYHSNYQGAPSNGSAWLTGGDGNRLLRGGSWFISPRYCRSAYRLGSVADYRFDGIGFRLALSLPGL